MSDVETRARERSLVASSGDRLAILRWRAARRRAGEELGPEEYPGLELVPGDVIEIGEGRKPISSSRWAGSSINKGPWRGTVTNQRETDELFYPFQARGDSMKAGIYRDRPIRVVQLVEETQDAPTNGQKASE